MYRLLLIFGFTTGTLGASVFGRAGFGQKIIWEHGRIIFPGDTFRSNIQYESDVTDNPEDENDITPEENPCTLTATPPDPDSSCCGIDASNHNFIVGGDATQIYHYPWLVHIEYYNRTQDHYKRLCDGFLISGRYVLSAAHCFQGEVFDHGTPVNVILGEYNTKNEGPDCITAPSGSSICTEGAYRVPIEEYTVHPKYLFQKAVLYNDIALVRLKRTIKYSSFVRPICLPSSDVTSSPASSSPLRFYVAGWGAVTDIIVRSNAGRTHQRTYDDLKQHNCSNTYTFLNQGHICAGGERGRDACRGDSGGPLMYQNEGIYEAVGMVSTGLDKYECGTEDRPGLYTKILPYVDWIRANIKP